MNIGFDLDKIFIDYPPLIPHGIIDRAYKKISKNQLIYRIPSRYEELFRLLLHIPILRRPIKKNISFVKKLTTLNKNKYFLISGRFGFLKNRTDEIIRKYKFDKIFNGLYFNFANNQPHLFKQDIIIKLKINLYVDDDLQLLRYLSLKNPKVKFFWLNNKESKKLENNLFAIRNLSEMFK